jgi:hypothetical protein
MSSSFGAIINKPLDRLEISYRYSAQIKALLLNAEPRIQKKKIAELNNLDKPL